MKCHICQFENPKHDKYCLNCNELLSTTSVDKQNPRGLNWIVFLFIGIILVLVLLVLFGIIDIPGSPGLIKPTDPSITPNINLTKTPEDISDKYPEVDTKDKSANNNLVTLLRTSGGKDLEVFIGSQNISIKVSDYYDFSDLWISEPKFSTDSRKIAFIIEGESDTSSGYQECKLLSFNILTKEVVEIDNVNHHNCIYGFDWINEDTLLFSQPGSKKLILFDFKEKSYYDVTDYSQDSSFDVIFNLDISPNGEFILFDKVRFLGFGADFKKVYGLILNKSISEVDIELPPNTNNYGIACSWAHNNEFFTCLTTGEILLFNKGGDLINNLTPSNNERYRIDDHSILWSLDSKKIFFIVTFKYPNAHDELLIIDIESNDQKLIEVHCTNEDHESLWPLHTLDQNHIYISGHDYDRDVGGIFKINLENGNCDYYTDGFLYKTSFDKNNIYYASGVR